MTPTDHADPVKQRWYFSQLLSLQSDAQKVALGLLAQSVIPFSEIILQLLILMFAFANPAKKASYLCSVPRRRTTKKAQYLISLIEHVKRSQVSPHRYPHIRFPEFPCRDQRHSTCAPSASPPQFFKEKQRRQAAALRGTRAVRTEGAVRRHDLS